MKKSQNTRKLAYSAVCVALAMVLPFLTAQIPQVASALCPMHIPVLLCGFIVGPVWGLAVGFISPLLRSVLFGIPVMYPGAVSMAFELCAYGLVSGVMYKLLPKKGVYVYVSLLTAMVAGRIVWGIARFIMAGLAGSSFPMSAFIAGAVTNAIPGIILHIVLIPVLVMAMQRAKLVLNK